MRAVTDEQYRQVVTLEACETEAGEWVVYCGDERVASGDELTDTLILGALEVDR